MACYKKTLLVILILFSIAVNIYFRLNSLFLPDIDESSRQEVYGSLRAELYEKLSSLYPDSLDSDKEKYAQSLFKPYLAEKKKEADRAVYLKSADIKDYYRDDRGYSYLIDTDCYRWLRRVENFLDTGHFGTTQIGKQEYDNLMFAPQGSKIEPIKLHYYIGAYFYKLLHSINHKLSLAESLAFLSPFLSIILVLAVFGISILSGISYLGSFLNSLAVGLANVVLNRTCFGWFDNDIYNIALPILIITVLAYSYKAKYPKNYLCLLTAGFLTGMHSSLWAFWWLPFYATLLGLLLYNLELVLYNKKESFSEKLKSSSVLLGAFVLFSYLSVFFFSGLEAIKKSFQDPYLYLTLRNGLALDNFWPSPAFSIIELMNPDVRALAVTLGGSFILYAGLAGVLLPFVTQKRLSCPKEKRFLMFTLFVWMLIMLFLTSLGRRFALFLIIPLGISVGASYDFLFRIDCLKRINAKLRSFLLYGIFLSACFILIQNASKVVVRPLFNDAYLRMMIKIRQVTPEDAIIASRWDLADYIMSVAKRATLNDASWQFSPLTYWENKSLLSRNEREALGIYKMLSSGSNNAFDELSNKLNKDKYLTIKLINKMLTLDREESLLLLSKYINDKKEINKILDSMYAGRRPVYLIVDNFMNNAIVVIGKIAAWDFERFDLWQKFRETDEKGFVKYAVEKFGYTEKPARQMRSSLKLLNKKDSFDWISPNKFKIYTVYSRQKAQNNPGMMLFDNGIAVDLAREKSYFRNDNGKWISPGRLILFDKPESRLNEYVNNEGDLSLCVFLTREDRESYKAILISSAFADTLFFKLYFTAGVGQDYFQLLHQEKKEGFSNLYLYKINLENLK